MTRRAAILLCTLSLAAALLVIAAGARHTAAARARARGAETQFARVKADAARVLALRSRSQTVAAGEQPQQDVFRRVNETLAAAGLSHVRVQSVNPGGDQSLDGARRVQTVRIVLEPLTLDELGSLLDRWRRDQAPWTVTGVDLAAKGAAYRATLTASAVYVPTTLAGTSPP
ncbi:MAG: hypothetical protein ACF8R9_11955 [Phycisphaerales bacterium JB054]